MFITDYFYWYLFSSCNFFSQEEPQGSLSGILLPVEGLRTGSRALESTFLAHEAKCFAEPFYSCQYLVASSGTLGLFILFLLLFSFSGVRGYAERERLGNTHFVSTVILISSVLEPKGFWGLPCVFRFGRCPYNQLLHFHDFFTAKISHGRET